MASLDTAIANIALPAIAADLHVSPADVVWVVNVYQIALVATLLPLGALGEIVGHQRIYIGGLLLFTLASLGCACAWSLPSLLVARDAAGARRQRHHERQRGAGALRLSDPHARPRLRPQRAGGRRPPSRFGPTIASGILALGPWPWLFAINIPFGLLAIAIGLKTLPHDAARHSRIRFPRRRADRQAASACSSSGSAARRTRRRRRWCRPNSSARCCSAGC